ncbi:hypothetical protein [Moheibacter sp.]|uniref:hypothetical protein n=1 Tax=Moheibacter sp. TaxID=1965316 RepID=UPI003C790624
MRFAFCMLMSVFFVFSCKSDSKTPIAQPVEFDKAAYAENLKKERDSLNSEKVEVAAKPETDSATAKKTNLEFTETTDTILVKFIYGKAKIDTAKLPRQKMVFLLNSDTANKIWLKLSTQDSLANLRISQIIDSKGNSDGPFGRELEFPVVEKGMQTVIVSESQMQGDAWGGKFSLEAQLIW